MPASTPTSAKTNVSVAQSTYLPVITGYIVNIRVGGSTTFRVHEDVLQQSPFFSNTLKPEWVARRAGKPILLLEEDPDIFAGYVQWLYSHNVDTTFATIKCAKLYVLGEKLLDNAFQDAVLEVMIQAIDAESSYPINDEINIIYDGTPEGSPARRLLVDYFAWGATPTWFRYKDTANTKPQDFVNDLLVALVNQRRSLASQNIEKDWIKDPSKYFSSSKTAKNQ